MLHYVNETPRRISRNWTPGVPVRGLASQRYLEARAIWGVVISRAKRHGVSEMLNNVSGGRLRVRRIGSRAAQSLVYKVLSDSLSDIALTSFIVSKFFWGS